MAIKNATQESFQNIGGGRSQILRIPIYKKSYVDPSLWIFDYRCSTLEEDIKWNAKVYSKSLAIIQKWLDQIS
jgi:hypothetical protein